MYYYIEVPFGHNDQDKVRGRVLDDDLLHYHGSTFLRISGRQFDRISKSFRNEGWSHQVTGVRIKAAKTEGMITLLLAPRGDLPGQMYVNRKGEPEPR